MPKKKQVFEPENLESIRSAISGLIVEPPETIEPVVYSVDLLSRHDPYYPMVQGEATSRLAMTATRNMAINPITGAKLPATRSSRTRASARSLRATTG